MRPPLLITPLLAFAAASAISAGTLAAYSAVTDNGGNVLGAGTVALSDNDDDRMLLELDEAAPGASATGCIRVRSDGTLPSLVRMRARAAGGLLPHMRVKITRGQSGGDFGDCDQFTPDSRDHHGLGAGVLYDGPLAALTSTWETALPDPSNALPATSTIPLLAARDGMVGLWELGEVTSRADDFRGTAFTLLSAHRELAQNQPWTRASTSPEHAQLTRNGGVASRNDQLAVYTQSSTTSTQVLSAIVRVNGATGEAGVVARASANVGTGYVGRYLAASGTWELGRLTAGTITPLASWVKPVPAGREAHLALRQEGSSLTLTVTAHDGATHQLTATDSTYGATGMAAIRVAGEVELDDYRLINPGLLSAISTVGSQASGNAQAVPGNQASATDVQAGAVFSGGQHLVLAASGLSSTLTVAGWFRLEGGAVLMRDSTTQPSSAWSLGYDDDGTTMKYRVAGQVFDTHVPVSALRNTWRHHALVRDGATVRYLLDGRVVHTGTLNGTPGGPMSPWNVMRDGPSGAFSTGRADQIAIWNRAVGADELAAIRDASATSTPWHQGREHWYRIHVGVDNTIEASGRAASAVFDWEARSR